MRVPPVFLLVIIVIILAGCGENNKNGKVIFHIQQAMDRMAYLEQVPFFDEKKKIIDSARIKRGNDEIIFTLPAGEERVFRLKVSDSPVDIYFVNDVPELEVSVAILKPDQFTISRSPANESLTRFLREQDALADSGRKLAEQMEGRAGDSLSTFIVKRNFDSLQRVFFDRYHQYTDTVKSPGAFLLVYNHVDFGKNYKAHKEFILRAAKRFPDHSRIQLLKDRTLDYLKIFEEEYQVGQQIPDIVLPAENGMSYSTTTLRGKYYLLNFWSSWCNICFPYNEEIKKAKQILPEGSFDVVSIAIDSEKEQWKNLVGARNLNWIQLIDEQMWQGPAVRTYKIDSIPFNFLVDPGGRIILKAIPADSLVYTLKKYVK